jgi:hypothetical protein
LQAIVKQGITPKELENLVEIPETLLHVWCWFLDLHSTRPSGFGVSAITYSEIKAYFELLQLKVEPWEIELIKRFDRIAMEVISEQQEKAEKRKSK